MLEHEDEIVLSMQPDDAARPDIRIVEDDEPGAPDPLRDEPIETREPTKGVELPVMDQKADIDVLSPRKLRFFFGDLASELLVPVPALIEEIDDHHRLSRQIDHRDVSCLDNLRNFEFEQEHQSITFLFDIFLYR